jgi:ribosomal protein S18 acetylase RimI-like enzyme
MVITIRDAKIEEASIIRDVLSEAFKPYKHLYSTQAYNATVLSIREIEKRIKHPHIKILVADYQNLSVGTVSIADKQENEIYIQSMAVTPSFQNMGIGWSMLREIEKMALRKRYWILSLECYIPLVNAKNLYKRFGFRETGNIRDYYGINIFEMIKNID